MHGENLKLPTNVWIANCFPTFNLRYKYKKIGLEIIIVVNKIESQTFKWCRGGKLGPRGKYDVSKKVGQVNWR